VAIEGAATRAEPAPASDGITDELLGESRWPPLIAIVVFMALNIAVRIWLPAESAIRLPWVLPAVEAVLLVVLITSHPWGVVERRRLRRIALALVFLLVLAALWVTTFLVVDLIRGKGVANDADQLLAAGAIVFLGNNLAFTLLYWLVDGGGPISRMRLPMPVDFAFPQHLSPEVAPRGWRPVFLDYLYLGFTNSTAFSPTDVMPLTHRAKFAMVVQSTMSLVLFGLVVARAVNAFT
jgi:hypothetical protein